ncbi:MAG: hypothetical protein GY830_09135 [Bacteroidetes bacterium]|nr:hypothetical protein [Bacteroidota bacterium]
MQSKKKFKKTFNINLVKQDYSYTISEIAELFNIHKQTITTWKKEGLRKNDDTRPYLFYGAEIKRFLKNRQNTRKIKCKDNELFCMKCRKPVKSWENIVDIKILNENFLNIEGICNVCSSKINKINSIKNLNKLQAIFNVQVIHNKHLIESFKPSVITHFNKEGKND